MKYWIDKVFSLCGLVRRSVIIKQLNYSRNVAKRLDEHREVVESISTHTSLLESHSWHISHLATQDDYLIRLFKLVYGYFPDSIHEGKTIPSLMEVYVRPRPSILGKCRLPEYEDC